MTLVIMAAGMGSRFGGLKQIEPIGPNGEYLLDYSIYDAIEAGFDKVIFIIKEENYDVFRETVGKRIEDKIEVSYVFQDINNVPSGVIVPSDRVKPWGTTHAVWVAKHMIQGDFVVINADDFYGREAFMTMKQFLDNSSDDHAMVGYRLGNTLSNFGSAKRGVCEMRDGKLVNLIESVVTIEDGKIKATTLLSKEDIEVDQNTLVSMTFFGFKPSILPYIDTEINNFFRDSENDLNTMECLIPICIGDNVKKGNINLEVLKCDAKWLGMTYKEDKEEVISQINEMIKKRIYPEDLWGN